MTPSRRLTLQREALRTLTPDELDSVLGGRDTEISCLDYITCFPCLPETFVCPA